MNNELISIKNISSLALSKIGNEHFGLPTGIYELDNKIRGLKPSEYIFIAGRPAMGKTSLATTMALTSGEEHKIIFFSIEMNPIMLVQRMLANMAEVNLYKFHQGKMLPSAWDKLKSAQTRLEEKNIWLDGSSFITPYEIANKLAQIDNFDMVIIDYIQLMVEGKQNFSNREEELGAISRQLKALANDANKPVIVLSQVNRLCLTRPNHRPFLGEMRGSGSLEQDADIVLFIHREGQYNPSKDNGSAEIIIAKNRNGPTGVVNCYFNKDLARFENYKERNDW